MLHHEYFASFFFCVPVFMLLLEDCFAILTKDVFLVFGESSFSSITVASFAILVLALALAEGGLGELSVLLGVLDATLSSSSSSLFFLRPWPATSALPFCVGFCALAGAALTADPFLVMMTLQQQVDLTVQQSSRVRTQRVVVVCVCLLFLMLASHATSATLRGYKASYCVASIIAYRDQQQQQQQQQENIKIPR